MVEWLLQLRLRHVCGDGVALHAGATAFAAAASGRPAEPAPAATVGAAAVTTFTLTGASDTTVLASTTANAGATARANQPAASTAAAFRIALAARAAAVPSRRDAHAGGAVRRHQRRAVGQRQQALADGEPVRQWLLAPVERCVL